MHLDGQPLDGYPALRLSGPLNEDELMVDGSRSRVS